MLSKSSKWELSFVHYIVKFTISRFVISRFEFTSYLITISLSLKFYACMTNVAVYLGKFFHVISSIHYWFDLTPCQLICYCCIINLGSILSITKVNSFCEWLLLLNLEKKITFKISAVECCRTTTEMTMRITITATLMTIVTKMMTQWQQQ